VQSVTTGRGRQWWTAFLVVGFVQAGSLKSLTAKAGVPVDLTVALAALTLVVVLVRSARSVPPEATRALLGFLLLAPPLLWTSSTPYADQKVSRLFTLTLLSLIAPVVLVRSVQDARRMLVAWVALCGISVVAVLIAPQASASWQGAPVVAFGSNTISTASSAGLVIIVLSLAVMWHRVVWFVGLPLIGAAVYALLLTGSRGPVLATVVATLAAILLARERPRLSRSVPVIGISAVLLAQLFALAPAASRERLLTLLHVQVVDDTATRVELYQQAWHSFWVRPLGLGWGGFQELDVRGYPYPHDLPLEVLAEGGVVCGTLFLLWLGHHYVRVRNVQAGFTGSAVFGLLTFALIESFVSGDLNDAKSLFFALGLGMALASPLCPTADVPWGDADGDPGHARGAPLGASPRHDPAAGRQEIPGRQRLRARG
jgi:hypothetical protein